MLLRALTVSERSTDVSDAAYRSTLSHELHTLRLSRKPLGKSCTPLVAFESFFQLASCLECLTHCECVLGLTSGCVSCAG